MPTIYSWVVSSMEITPSLNGQANVVVNVKWVVKASDGVNEAKIGGSTDISFDQNDQFIEYSDLTQDIVIDWVKNILNDEEISSITSSLDAHLLTLANPPVVSLALPWA